MTTTTGQRHAAWRTIALTFALTLLATTALAAHDHQHHEMRMGAKKTVYTCPMKSEWHVRSMEPGSCHLCGMKLVDSKTIKGYKAPKLKKGEKLYTCPMKSHWHVVSHKPGTCHLCKMKLVGAKTLKGYKNPYARKRVKKKAPKSHIQHGHSMY